MADGFEWAFEGEQNQVCETEQSSVNKDRHMKYAQSGRTSVKQGGTAGVSSCPGRIAGTGDFLFSRSGKKKGENQMKNNEIPYKTYLSEDELPKKWYNVRADMKNKPAPLLNPATMQPVTVDELSAVFCRELAEQELDDTTPYIDIPEEIFTFYKMYRPSPLVRAYCLEKALGTPAKIYYKFEGNNTSGSHKLNSAIAQAYYAKKQGLRGVTTETGAGQWGTALSMACAYFGLECKVYMVKCSYEQKPFRREVMRTYGASVTPSPSMETQIGQKILRAHPGTTGSLGCAISEAVEAATTREGYRYVLGSVAFSVSGGAVCASVSLNPNADVSVDSATVYVASTALEASTLGKKGCTAASGGLDSYISGSGTGLAAVYVKLSVSFQPDGLPEGISPVWSGQEELWQRMLQETTSEAVG